MNAATEQYIREVLLARQLLEPEQLEAMQIPDGDLINLLVQNRVLSETAIYQALADQYHLPFVDLAGFSVDAALFNILSAAQAMHHEVVPYALEEECLQVVTANLFDPHLEARLETLTGRRVALRVSTPSAIAETLKRSEGTSQVLRDLSEEFKPVIVKETRDGREETVRLEAVDEESAPVIRLVNSILNAALQRRASDIHIEAFEHGIEVKYRIDGVLYPATEVLARQHHAALISRLKVMAELDIAEKRIPQDGRFKLRIGQRDIDFRVSILPGVFGEDVVIRILDKSTLTEGMQQLSLENLGMSAQTLKKFRKAIHEPYGMVLMTGPTGSGKTTTLYGALSELNTGQEKIITIEDPVEYQLDGIVQIPVNEKKELTFARGLRSILRHDPDKIMVGEIRDAETAKIAVQSALTGHLVFTTVHANNAFDVISRFSHMGVDVYSFVSALNCVVAQRLVRKLCSDCKRPVQPEPGELEQSGLDGEQPQQARWHDATGCPGCHGTGYHGRIAITELLELSPRIREMIIDRRPVNDMQQVAKEEGMVTLRQAALEKAMQGITSLQEINRVTFVD
ncbi:MAG: GspE/PulE family protein [Thiohalophilus sp.]